MRRIEVLILAPEFGGAGGIQRVTRSLAHAVADVLGVEALGLAVLRGERPSHITHFASARLSTRRVSSAAKVRFTATVLSATYRYRPLVLVSHAYLAPVAWLSRLLTGSPYGVWCHGREVWTIKGKLVRLALRRANLVFAPSEFTARRVESLLMLRGGSVRIIPHTLTPELHRIVAEKTKSPSVLTVARLDRSVAYKGVDTLIKLWPVVISQVPEARLSIAGYGDDIDRLRRLAGSAPKSSIEFLGEVSDSELAQAYSSSWIFALPGRHSIGDNPQGEGFGLASIEAALYGLPVVVGQGGGTGEAVQDEVTGFVIDMSDPAILVEKLLLLIRNPSQAKDMGERGRRWVEESFSFDSFRRNIRDVIQELKNARFNVRRISGSLNC